MQENVAILIPCTSISQPGISDSLETEGVHCVMAAPLRYEQRTVGLIYADSRNRDSDFQEDDLRVLTALANIAAARIELARLLEEERELIRHDHELRAAAAVQRRLLPRKAAPIRGYVVDGFNRPCFEVGGDFYDYLPLGNGRHGIVLADVAGKGLPAALLLMGVQAYTRAYVGLRPGVDGLAGFLNDGMLRYAPRNRFVSYFFLELDASSSIVRWCNAGHAPRPTIIRTDGSTQRLDPGGPPLGVVADSSFPVLENELSEGDLLVVCSDGVTDAANAHEEPYGEERLDALLESMAGRSPKEVRQRILDAVADHVQETPHSDDLTVVAIRRDTR
jgi:serine phosphatase RsbU (regulator of sigma subunit)